MLYLLILAIILSNPALSEVEQSKLTVRKVELAAQNPARAVEDIRTAFSSGLPLAAEWNIGQTGRGWTLDYQVDLIRQGYRILPTIFNPLPNRQGNNAEILGKWLLKNRTAIEQLRDWKLPICLRSPNWLDILTAKPPSKYRVPFERLPESPLAWRIDENGEPDDMPVADPMGPVSRWQELGEDVAGSLWVKTLAEIYPDPPLIYFLENNEGARRYTYGDYWLAVADSVREIYEIGLHRCNYMCDVSQPSVGNQPEITRLTRFSISVGV